MKIGFTAGVFDLLHPGHTNFLWLTKNQYDLLRVGLQTDPTKDRKNKNAPIQSVYERWYQLACCKYVDQVIPYSDEKDLLNLYKTNPDINAVFIGSDHRNDTITGQDYLALHEIPIVFIDRYHDYSSSELRKRIIEKGK